MDPLNNLVDFIHLIYPKRAINPAIIACFENSKFSDKENRKKVMTDYEILLADCPPPTACPALCSAPCKEPFWGPKNAKKKDKSPMNYASATVIAQDNTERDQRRFLSEQLYTAYYTAKTALERKFGLIDDEAPKTLLDTVKRIQDGLFVIPEKYKDEKVYGGLGHLRWRDPKTVEDKDGFEAAKDELKKARNAVERTITILSPAEGLKALQDFEAANAPK